MVEEREAQSHCGPFIGVQTCITFYDELSLVPGPEGDKGVITVIKAAAPDLGGRSQASYQRQHSGQCGALSSQLDSAREGDHEQRGHSAGGDDGGRNTGTSVAVHFGQTLLNSLKSIRDTGSMRDNG